MENLGLPDEGVEVLVRVLADEKPSHRVDGAYLFGQTEDNQQAVFETACDLITTNQVARLLIPRSAAKSGYPGFGKWCEGLQQHGIPRDRIEGVELEHTAMLHTLIETEALVAHARQNGYITLGVVAPPFHQLRAFMTCVTVAASAHSRLRLYSFPGVALPWNEQVVHSQGTLHQDRRQLIRSELERIYRYQKQNDLTSFERVRTYLDHRDRATDDTQ